MRIGLIGAGNMARAMARGWGEPVVCSDGGSGRAQELVAEVGGEAVATNLEVAERADLVVLCHKPGQLEQVSEEVAGTARAVASVLGGTPTSRVQACYPKTPVFALMPNTPVEVRRGVIIYAERGESVGADSHGSFAGAKLPGVPELELQVLELFGRLGEVVRVPEKLFDAATGVTGVGPAYVALLVEAQVDAAVRHGLPAPLASRLVAEMMTGTVQLLVQRGYDTLAVRREVTSPGGSTARGLDALERAGVRRAFSDALDAVVRPPERAR